MSSGVDLNSEEAQDRAWRKAERARLIAARLALPQAEHQAATGAILLSLSGLLERIPPKTIAGYWPVRCEVDCRPFLADAFDKGAHIALPAVVGKETPLEFRAWPPGTAVEAGPMTIPQPASRELLLPDCVVIALVGFDARNYRLGYGAGYYDRTLAAMDPKPVTIGLGFEFQRLDSIRPHAFDVPLDYVVTEKGVQARAI